MANPFSFNLGEIAPNARLQTVQTTDYDREADQMADFYRKQLLFEKQIRDQQQKQLAAESKVKDSFDFGAKITNFDGHIDSLITQADQRAKATRGTGLNDQEKALIIKSEYTALGKDLRTNKLNRQYTSDYSTILVDDVIKRYKTPKAPSEQSSGFLGGLGDVGLSLGQGVAGSVKALTDLAGAGNVVSQSLDNVSKWLQENKTEASKAERKQIEAAIKKAEESGSTKEEVFAYLNAFKDQPLEMLAQGLGSFATLGFGKAAQAAKLANLTGKGVEAAQAVTKAAELGRNVNIGIGTAQGIGSVKGSQYEVTFNEAKKSGLSDEQAAAIANDAQAYTVDNAGRQLLGGALGLIATATGPIEKAILGKAVEKQGSTLARISKGVLTEAGTEAAQEGQSAEAGNVAAINAGLLDPSQQFRGVAGSAAQAAAVGGILGGGADILTPGIQQSAPIQEQPNGPITPDPVAPTSARQAADWRNQISQGQVPAEIQAWSQQNNIPVAEAIQIHQQALGAPSANPGQILAAANGSPTKFFQGVDLDTISQVEVPIGDGADALTGPELVAQINEAIGIVSNAQSRPKTSYQGYVNEDAVTEVTNAKEFLKQVQKSVTANPQILTQAKQVFEAKKQDAVKGTVASRAAGATETLPSGGLGTDARIQQATDQIQAAATAPAPDQVQQVLEQAAAQGQARSGAPQVSEEVNQILAQAASQAPQTPDQILEAAAQKAPEQQGIIIADEYRARAEQAIQAMDEVAPEVTTALMEAADADNDRNDTQFTELTNEADNIIRSIEEVAGEPGGDQDTGGVTQEAGPTETEAVTGQAQGEVNAVQTEGQAQEVKPTESETVSQDMLPAVQNNEGFVALPESKDSRESRYASMTRNELELELDRANEVNTQLDEQAVLKYMGTKALEEFRMLRTQRAKDSWWDKNATTEMDEEGSSFKGIDDERVREYISAINDFDDESPEAMGRSIALKLRKADEPGFVNSPDYVTVRNALQYASDQGWNADTVLSSARSRAIQWAGSDAQELFPRLFKQAGAQNTANQIRQQERASSAPQLQAPQEASEAKKTDAKTDVPETDFGNTVVEPETQTVSDNVEVTNETTGTGQQGQEATTEIAEAEVTPEEGRSYHIVAINEKTGDKTYLTKEPLQHSKAVAMKNKFSSNPARRVQLEDVTGGGYTRARSSLNKTSSWVIRDKNTGDLMMETFDQKKVENLNTDKYEAVPILEYLQELNAKSKAETATTPQQESEFADLASKIAGSNLIIKCNI
jgi:hypothetical protein